MEQEEILQDQENFISDLASLFDLLARFDFEDNQKEKFGPNTGFPVSAPGKSILDSNSFLIPEIKKDTPTNLNE